jgi:hypothetical protein
LPSIGWHSFRHTVSAWGKEAGLELEDVKTLSRHENIANHLGDLWGFGPRSEATDSAKADQSYPSGKHTVDGGRKASLIRDCQDYVRE